MYFIVGEIYENLLTGRHVKVDSSEDTEDGFYLEVQEVAPVTMKHLFHNVVSIKKEEFYHWELVELVKNVENK